MAITSQNIAFDDNLESAKLVKLGWNLCQNDRFERNITDFCRNNDNDGDAKFTRVIKSKLRGGTALRCNIYSAPSANTRVRHDVFVGAIANAKIIHVAFDAFAEASKVVGVQLYHVVGSAGRATAKSVTVTTNPETHYVSLLTTAATTSGFLGILFGADATSITISNIRIYVEEDSVTLPRFQSVNLDSVSGNKPAQSIDGRNSVDRMLSLGATKLTVVDPYCDSDPMFWENILHDHGRDWQEGLQYLDGDMIENPSGLWTLGAETLIAWESSTKLVDANCMSIIGDTTTRDVTRAEKTIQDNPVGESLFASAWTRCDSGTIYANTAGIIRVFDGVSSTYSTYATLTSSGWIKSEANAIIGSATSSVLVGLYGKPSATDNKVYFDAIKIEQDYQSPFIQQASAYLWALKVQFIDGTYRYSYLVPRIRWNADKLPLSPSQFLTQSISGTGDQLLMSRETK